MAEVVAPGHGRHTSSATAMAIPGGPTIEMIPNPDFSFPMNPSAASTSTSRRRQPSNDATRPSSMHASSPPSQGGFGGHRRAVSTLPSFSFNPADSSGLRQTPDTTPPETPQEDAPITPQRRGHRRGGSEFVGGDSRLGVSSAVSTSPTKATNALPVPAPTTGPPAGRRGHSHRRSAAISSHDLSDIMRPSDAQPPLSSSLPNTPMERPGQSPPLDRTTSAPDARQDLFGPPLEEQEVRPPSRPRVGFSDNVEIIPRPLSTISSETESSMSTVRGHSVNNSISSMLSLGTPSPPSTRPSRVSLSAPLEDEPKPRVKSSVEISRRVEKEGEWLKSRSSQSLKRPLSESAAAPPKTAFVEPETPARRRAAHKKKQSLSHALGLDRRRSEPAIGLASGDESRNSAVSLGSLSSVSDATAYPLEPTSSTKRFKAWASAKISKKPKESQRAISEASSRSSLRPESAGSGFVPGKVTAAPETPAAETDINAVLDSATPKASQEQAAPPAQPTIEVSSASPTTTAPAFKHSWRDDDDDDGAMLDLDAALGPFKTPPMGGAQRQRKELHSSRLTRDFTGPGGHYHRRAESAPALPPFDYSPRVGTPSQSSMADVFEEEEEEDLEDAMERAQKPYGANVESDEEEGTGISVVDSANAAGGAWNLGGEDALGINRAEWEPERPGTSYSNAASRLSTAGTDRRGSSLIEETIIEEASPIEAPSATGVEIVEAEDEPRASSLTKSSDSSETPTLLGPTATLISSRDGQHSTPDTYQTSTFSSPDFSRRQTSFDASRLGTAASSIADTRTTSSCATGEHGSDVRMSVDDVPSLTSSRSTMLSTAQANHSQRNIAEERTPSSSSDQDAMGAERRAKRGSIASLSQLLSSRSKDHDQARPKTAAEPASATTPAKKKEHRLKKLMFWKAKHSGQRDTTRSQP